MSRRTTMNCSGCVLFLLGIGVGYLLTQFGPDPATRAEAGEAETAAAANVAVQSATSLQDTVASPVQALSLQDVYYPGTEDLAPDEMRVTACGTGMPNARPKQAAACWLVELGNGDRFLFDIGTGAAERISAMKIPYNYLNKVFI